MSAMFAVRSCCSSTWWQCLRGGWVAAGYLRGLIAPQHTRVKDGTATGRFGFPEVGIPLGAAVLLFGGFVAIQASYLFGGEDLVQRATGMGFAQYARRGFFELVTASALVVPLLLVGRPRADSR